MAHQPTGGMTGSVLRGRSDGYLVRVSDGADNEHRVLVGEDETMGRKMRVIKRASRARTAQSSPATVDRPASTVAGSLST